MNNSIRSVSRGRSMARKCAMQALYQWQMTHHPASELLQQYIGSQEMGGADVEYFTELVRECTAKREELDTELAQFVDRPVGQLDPVEHAILWVGMYELTARLDIPYRVVINEAVELTKRFGATDGHRYVNAVLDKAGRAKRVAEQG